MSSVSRIHRHTIEILDKYTEYTPQLGITLYQLCGESRATFASLISELEMTFQMRMCNTRNIEWLRNRTVAFLIWALERSVPEPSEEFSWFISDRDI